MLVEFYNDYALSKENVYIPSAAYCCIVAICVVPQQVYAPKCAVAVVTGCEKQNALGG